MIRLVLPSYIPLLECSLAIHLMGTGALMRIVAVTLWSFILLSVLILRRLLG
jgi:hypothetical protein